jgi:hypothetical protein
LKGTEPDYRVQPWQISEKGYEILPFPGCVLEAVLSTSATAKPRIANQESLDGKDVDWLEKVSDEQYSR